ncbi:hypothetical protein HD553DRAFT_324559 [Filobasidium floriforme]|uniref:uncharacterized protein n=1 Tax=Filobasidium floriforme TaxID=5210 RepID=UPI001E8E9FB4|nr:uncharacterized protein HD553DRAFT_324559 [Filobasidium floriforme]KAH8083682.1 hypothetical protein HD553DRAFT_324559 [Filobasidium floriforme]
MPPETLKSRERPSTPQHYKEHPELLKSVFEWSPARTSTPVEEDERGSDDSSRQHDDPTVPTRSLRRITKKIPQRKLDPIETRTDTFATSSGRHEKASIESDLGFHTIPNSIASCKATSTFTIYNGPDPFIQTDAYRQPSTAPSHSDLAFAISSTGRLSAKGSIQARRRDRSSAQEKQLDSFLMARPISTPPGIPPEPVLSKEDIELMGSYSNISPAPAPSHIPPKPKFTREEWKQLRRAVFGDGQESMAICEQVMVPSSDDGFDPPRPPPRFGWSDGSMKSATDTAKQDRTVQVAGEIESYKELASSQRSWGQSIFCVMFDAVGTPVGSPHDDEGQILAKSGQEVLFGDGDSFGRHDGIKRS